MFKATKKSRKGGKRIISLIALNLGFLLLVQLPVVNVHAADNWGKVKVSVKPLDLSRVPTDKELMAAGQLGGLLYPTFEEKNQTKKDAENFAFGEAIQLWNKHHYEDAVELFRKYTKKFPDSPWLAEAELHVGCAAIFNGRYSEAEEIFKRIIENNKDSDYEGAKRLVNKATLRMANLKTLENNFDEASEHYANLYKNGLDWRDRTYASNWIQRLSLYKADKYAMLNCGALALSYLLEKDGKKSEARKVMDMRPSSLKGFNLKELKSIAKTYGYNFTGLKISTSDLKKIPLPAVVHIEARSGGDSGHYWILEKINSNNEVELVDPQSKRRYEQSIKEFGKEWNGNALVFSSKGSLPGKQLAENEISNISGGCCGIAMATGDLGSPGGNDMSSSNNGPGPDSGCGAPTWQVNAINLNFFVSDTPLWYNPPIGPSVGIKLSYNSKSATAQYEPFGNKWQLGYGTYLVEDPGDDVQIFMPDGRRDVFTYNGSGYDPPVGVHNELTSVTNNNFELRFPNDTVYVFDIPDDTISSHIFLTEIKDVHNQSLTFEYDANVQLTAINDALDLETTLTYSNGLVTQVTDPYGRSASFEYSTDSNLTKITDMGGFWVEFGYDQDVYISSVQNQRGTWNIYTEPPDGLDYNFSYYPGPEENMWESYRITITDPLGEKEEYFYYGANGEYSWYVSPRDYLPYVNSANNLYARNAPRTYYYVNRSSSVKKVNKIVYPEGNQVEFGYDTSTEELLSIEDSNNHTNSFTYNSMGKITSHTDPKGNVTTIEYDPVNSMDPVAIINGLGTVTNQFNDYHQVTLTNDRLGNETSFVYSSGTGLMTSWTRTLANAQDITANYYYDSDYFLTDIVSGGHTLANFTYDTIGSEKIGRIKTYTNAADLTLTYDYNSLNNVTKITYPDSKFISFTYSDCCPHIRDSITDRSGRTTEFTYDALKRLTGISNPETGLSSFVYDPNGNMTKFIDPNSNVTSYEYDLNNRPVKKTYDDDKFETYVYNTDGLMATFINARNITTYNLYDENHNLYSVDYSDSTPGISFQYDNYNRVTQRQDGIGTYSFGYDARSRLISYDGPWANDSISNQYDEIGRRLGLSIDGSLLYSNSYDGFSRLTDTQIGTASSTYSYIYTNANPLVQSLTRPNGSVTTYQYDSLNRLETLSNQNSGSTVINQYSYVYSNDLRSSETITNGSAITFSDDVITYDYNAVNQLLASTNTNSNQSFTYDADGNMTRGYTIDGYIFSASYDAENRLDNLEYTDVSSVVHKTEYQYSGDSFLAIMKKYDAGTLTNETRFVRYGLLPLQERNSSNNVTREYAWGLNMGGGIGGLLNVKQSGQNYSYLYDGKGNVTAVIDSAEATAATYTYDAFGNLMVKTGSLDQPFQFSTKRYDNQTGLVYYGYRFYSPALGRWITRDPLGEAGGINLYVFTGNSPINWIDPWGLEPECCYDISEGTMICTDDDGTIVHSSDGWVSGRGDHQNNPDSTPIEDTGPIPTGDYTSKGPPNGKEESETTRRKLTNDPETEMYGRHTFQTHYCPDTATCSEGCPSQPNWDDINDFNDLVDKNPDTPITVTE